MMHHVRWAANAAQRKQILALAQERSDDRDSLQEIYRSRQGRVGRNRFRIDAFALEAVFKSRRLYAHPSVRWRRGRDKPYFGRRTT